MEKKLDEKILKKLLYQKMYENIQKKFKNIKKLTSLLDFFQPFFTERVFQIFDKDNSGSISLQVLFFY
jgi:hypothetical protein